MMHAQTCSTVVNYSFCVNTGIDFIKLYNKFCVGYLV